ncbi:hypothetical protein JZ751_025698, partial [Albula glossodonta]
AYDGVSGGFCSQSRDTNGDARNNRASGTKTRGTDFWLLLPQLEGGQCEVKRVVRTTRDTFPARTMYPQGRHLGERKGKSLWNREPCSSPTWRIIDTIEQVPWETRSMEVYRQQNVDPVTLWSWIRNLRRDGVLVDFNKSARLARGPLE